MKRIAEAMMVDFMMVVSTDISIRDEWVKIQGNLGAIRGSEVSREKEKLQGIDSGILRLSSMEYNIRK